MFTINTLSPRLNLLGQREKSFNNKKFLIIVIGLVTTTLIIIKSSSCFTCSDK